MCVCVFESENHVASGIREIQILHTNRPLGLLT